ncbi:MAG: hypothetical protein ACP5QO_00420 [Clostridia bacterium]
MNKVLSHVRPDDRTVFLTADLHDGPRTSYWRTGVVERGRLWRFRPRS